MEKPTNPNDTPNNDPDNMRQRVADLERALARQKKIAFAAGIFQNDVTVRTLLESLAEGAIISDKSGAIVLTNKRAEELFGYQKNELIGHSLNVLLPKRFLQHHDRHVSNFFTTPHIRAMGQGRDLVGKHKNGSEFPVEISLSYLDTDVGRLGLAFITDITLRKQAEEALQTRNEELNAYAHTVAHELQASLASIIGYAEMLVDVRGTLSQAEADECIGALARNTRRMSSVIEELLVFASIREEDVLIQPLDMKLIVDNALDRLDYLIKESNAQIILPESYETAAGYAPWVEEIWLNYFSNALKYGGKPPVIRLGSTHLGDTIEFWIKDNGRGLTEEEQNNIFKSFAKSDAPRIKGHGLGLSIVKRIANKLRGHVRVVSTPGQGSTFHLILPAAGIDL